MSDGRSFRHQDVVGTPSGGHPTTRHGGPASRQGRAIRARWIFLLGT